MGALDVLNFHIHSMIQYLGQLNVATSLYHDDVINSPLTKASDAELWRSLWSAPEQTDKQTIETPVIWDAIALIMTSL